MALLANGHDKRLMPSALSRKARSANECRQLEELPNVGPALARELRVLGITHPSQLASANGFELYRLLCQHTGRRQDPCVLDTFLAIVDFMSGAPAAPWWHYTAERKRLYGQAYGDMPAAATA
jgi:hypothetical protein